MSAYNADQEPSFLPARLRYFIIRPENDNLASDGRVQKEAGVIVPLVALDQLPDWLEVVGAPRNL